MSSFVSIPDANDENPLDASKQGLVESKESKETFDGFNVDNIYAYALRTTTRWKDKIKGET